MALSFENNIDIIKINDPFLIAIDGLFMYKIEKNNINWKINKSFNKQKSLYKLVLKILIRLIHIYFHFSPYKKSYLIGEKNNYPKFIAAHNIRQDLSILRLIKESKNFDVVISGWGLRDWEMVLKHKKSIKESLISGFNNFLNLEDLNKDHYLFVHIRRSDFLEVDMYKELNFDDQIWIRSIVKICTIKKIEKVVIFSDSLINSFFISSLENKGLRVLLPERENNNISFLNLFFGYLNNGSFVLCNASSLALSVAFLSHESIYLPSRKNDIREILINEAHTSFPINLNWN